MFKNIFPLFFFVCLNTIAYSQTKFEQGYVVTKDGKQIDCLIKNERWFQSPKQIIYKLAVNEEELVAESANFEKFRVGNGPLYISHTGDFPIYKSRVSLLNPNAEIKTIRRSVFLKQIVSGKAKLYEFREGNDISFTYTIEDQPMVILLYGESVDKRNKIRTINTYKNQLYKKVICGNSIEIQKLKYERKSLESYFEVYNNCSGQEAEKETIDQDRPKSIKSVKVWGGMQQFNYEVKTLTRSFDYGQVITPKIGIEVESIYPYNNSKWSMFLATSYTQHTTDAIVTISNTVEVDQLESINSARIELLFGGRHYLFLNKTSSLFIELGVAFDFDLKGSFSGFQQQNETLEGQIANFAPELGFGYSYNQRLYLRINYYGAQKVIPLVSTESNKLTRISFSVGYKF